MGAIIPVAVECKKEIKGLEDAAERKSKFSSCARGQAISLITTASESDRVAFFEAKTCIVSYMVEVLQQ